VNKTAEIIETENSLVDPKRLFGMKGFGLERALDFDPKFLEESVAASTLIGLLRTILNLHSQPS
jgi:hypothetical protein